MPWDFLQRQSCYLHRGDSFTFPNCFPHTSFVWLCRLGFQLYAEWKWREKISLPYFWSLDERSQSFPIKGQVSSRFLIHVLLSSCIFFLWDWGLNSGPTSWPTPPVFLWWGFGFLVFLFQDRVSWTFCLAWLWTMILLISAFWVTRITSVSHQCPAAYLIF
jgi:hypothetical protein